MRVALLTDGIYPFVTGGMPKHSFYLAKYLAKKEVNVDLYHPVHEHRREPDKLNGFAQDEERFINSVPVDYPEEGKLPGHYLSEQLEYSKRVFEKLSANQNADVIYVQGFTGWHLLKQKEKGTPCPPVMLNFHGFEMFQRAPSIKSRMEQKLLRPPVVFNIKNADFVLSFGGKISEILSSLNISSEKIIEMPIGIEAEWLTDSISSVAGPRKFIFIGRYERRKGIEELVKVLPEMLENYQFEMNFIGPVPDKLMLKSDLVKYWGEISDMEKVQSILKQNDVLVCPSYAEGMPTVILEAMASGLAVIATDVGAVNAIVDDEKGWLINPGNEKELREAFQQAVDLSDELLLKKKQVASAFVKENLLWDNVIGQLLDHIGRIISLRIS